MEPEDIEGRDFFVGLRGYDRDEVQAFLTEVATGYRAVLAELEELRNRPVPEPAPAAPPRDAFEDLGASVTAILRTANQSAATIAEEAEFEAAGLREQAQTDANEVRARAEKAAEHVRSEADTYAEQIRSGVDTYAEHVRRDAESAALARDAAMAEATRIRDEVDGQVEQANRAVAEARAEADRLVGEAHHEVTLITDNGRAEADRLVTQARNRVAELEATAERVGRERAIAAAADIVDRVAAASARQEELRARLAEASDEIQIALMALGEPVRHAADLVPEAILHDERAEDGAIDGDVVVLGETEVTTDAEDPVHHEG